MAPDPYESLHPTQRRFLRCFEASCSIERASKWARIHRCNHYDWLEESESYAAAFAVAKQRAAQSLEDECIRRAKEGVRRAVRYRGKIVGYDTEFSDQLLLAALRAHHPDYKPVDPQAVFVQGGKDFSFEAARRALQEGPDLP